MSSQIRVLYNNARNSHADFQSLLPTLNQRKANILLMQEPPLDKCKTLRIEDFHCFPRNPNKSQTITYIRKNVFRLCITIYETYREFVVTYITLHSKQHTVPTIYLANIYKRIENCYQRNRESPIHLLDLLFGKIFSLSNMVAADYNKYYPV